MADKKKQNGSFFVILTVILLVSAMVIGYFAITSSGEKSGVEFSPDDFSMRSFDYNRISFLNWTRRGIDYRPYPFPTGKSLIADDLIRVTGRTPKRWHLVSESRAFSTAPISTQCDARFLTDYLGLTNLDGETIVLQWSNANPESAKTLWPLIAELARDEVYIPIPRLLDFALLHSKADSDPEFLQQLEQRVAGAWRDAARISQTDSDHQRAVRQFERAIELGGQSDAINAEKAKSLSRLDDVEK